LKRKSNINVGSHNLYLFPGVGTNSGLHLENFPRAPPNPSPHPTQSWFDLLVGAEYFPVLVDSSAGFTVEVTLAVTFLNTEAGAPVHTQKFLKLLAEINHPMLNAGDSTTPISAARSVGVRSKASSPIAPQETVLTTPVLAGIIGGGAGVLLLSVVAIVCYRRRKSTPQTTFSGAAATATIYTISFV